jgi:hypothetical protein
LLSERDLRIKLNVGVGVIRLGQAMCGAEKLAAAVKLMIRQSSRLGQNSGKAD